MNKPIKILIEIPENKYLSIMNRAYRNYWEELIASGVPLGDAIEQRKILPISYQCDKCGKWVNSTDDISAIMGIEMCKTSYEFLLCPECASKIYESLDKDIYRNGGSEVND